MLAWPLTMQSRNNRDLPPEIYISLVASLFSDPRTLIIGAIGTVGAALVTAFKTGGPLLFLCAFGMALVACARTVDMRAFSKRRERLTTVEAANAWEVRYVIGASVYTVLMGLWCMFAFTTTSDPFVQLLSFSMVLVNMIGVAGRNFGSKLLVNTQLACAGAPMTAALFSIGSAYYALLGCVLIPFFAAQTFIANRLRRTFVDSVMATQDLKLLAGRFDSALNNMPHGLCMFDKDRHLVVSNKRLGEILRISNDDIAIGKPVREFLLSTSLVETNAAPDLDRLVADFESALRGTFNGKLLLDSKDGRALSLTFQSMANGGSVVLVEDITEQRNAEAKITHLARYDPLTGLPNRTFFHEQMASALAGMRPDASCAVLFIDLDQFKQVNDTLGHPAGDMLLCAVARRLQAIVRETDVVARFGGDEFVILQTPVRRAEETISLARKVVEAVALPYEVEGHQAVTGASVGIAMAPRDGIDADVLMKNADMAVYSAKAQGRNGWRFFEPAMDARAQARRNLELDLRDALSTGALELHYQPIVNLKTGGISTCEALLRWFNPKCGLIPPSEFIPVAEEMGLIVEIGDWVLGRACAECAQWPDDVNVAVNLSPIQFSRGNVTRSVSEALRQASLAPNRLEIEITESLLLQNSDATRAQLYELRDLGVTISLDDFGTGYSSLSYLDMFPLHKVKIDQSFLHGSSERSLTLLSNVARLCTSLGMRVAVEGVETPEQLAFLAEEERIDEAQGYLLSPAIPAGEIRVLLDPGAMRERGSSRKVA